MVALAGLAGLLSLVIGWLVTARLFALAHRTRRAPERHLALGFGGLFCVGYPLAGASRAPGLTMTNEGSLLFALGAIGMIVGLFAFSRFPYLVFRPGTRWASFLSLLIGLGGAVGGIGATVSVAAARSPVDMITRIQPWALTLMASICLAFAWNACESILYYRNMKRRLALELADPETTHRFLLWSLASLSAVFSVGVVVLIRASGQPILASLPMAIIACGAIVGSACWWLAFFMPDAYRVRVLGITTEPG